MQEESAYARRQSQMRNIEQHSKYVDVVMMDDDDTRTRTTTPISSTAAATAAAATTTPPVVTNAWISDTDKSNENNINNNNIQKDISSIINAISMTSSSHISGGIVLQDSTDVKFAFGTRPLQ